MKQSSRNADQYFEMVKRAEKQTSDDKAHRKINSDDEFKFLGNFNHDLKDENDNSHAPVLQVDIEHLRDPNAKNQSQLRMTMHGHRTAKMIHNLP